MINMPTVIDVETYPRAKALSACHSPYLHWNPDAECQRQAYFPKGTFFGHTVVVADRLQRQACGLRAAMLAARYFSIAAIYNPSYDDPSELFGIEAHNTCNSISAVWRT